MEKRKWSFSLLSRCLFFFRLYLFYFFNFCIKVVGPCLIILASVLILIVTFCFFIFILPSFSSYTFLFRFSITCVGLFILFNIFYNYFKACFIDPGSPPLYVTLQEIEEEGRLGDFLDYEEMENQFPPRLLPPYHHCHHGDDEEEIEMEGKEKKEETAASRFSTTFASFTSRKSSGGLTMPPPPPNKIKSEEEEFKMFVSSSSSYSNTSLLHTTSNNNSNNSSIHPIAFNDDTTSSSTGKKRGENFSSSPITITTTTSAAAGMMSKAAASTTTINSNNGRTRRISFGVPSLDDEGVGVTSRFIGERGGGGGGRRGGGRGEGGGGREEGGGREGGGRREGRGEGGGGSERSCEMRKCLKCLRIKPPRCHHCSVCGRCILKMDHHCPWINGCVGFHNYRFFVLFIFWLFLGSVFVVIFYFPQFMLSVSLTLPPPSPSALPPSSIVGITNSSPNASQRPSSSSSSSSSSFVSLLISFLLLLSPYHWQSSYHRQIVCLSWIISLSILMALAGLGGVHFHFSLTNQTTIEFQSNCVRKRQSRASGIAWRNPYDLGRSRNFQQIFGSSPYFLWTLPYFAKAPVGNGMSFPSLGRPTLAL